MLSWFAMFFSLAGVYLNAKKRRVSWLVWLVANASWATVGYRIHDYPMMLVQIIYFGFGIYGWFQWREKK